MASFQMTQSCFAPCASYLTLIFQFRTLCTSLTTSARLIAFADLATKTKRGAAGCISLPGFAGSALIAQANGAFPSPPVRRRALDESSSLKEDKEEKKEEGESARGEEKEANGQKRMDFDEIQSAMERARRAMMR